LAWSKEKSNNKTPQRKRLKCAKSAPLIRDMVEKRNNLNLSQAQKFAREGGRQKGRWGVFDFEKCIREGLEKYFSLSRVAKRHLIMRVIWRSLHLSTSRNSFDGETWIIYKKMCKKNTSCWWATMALKSREVNGINHRRIFFIQSFIADCAEYRLLTRIYISVLWTSNENHVKQSRVWRNKQSN
jgi:hypothetical protein